LLGHWSIISLIALTRKHLAATDWTLLTVTAINMKLSLDNSAVVTRMLVCSPIIALLAVANTLTLYAADKKRGLQLCHLNLLRPALNHPNAVVNDKLLAHGGAKWPNNTLTGRVVSTPSGAAKC
jgi:hypothetical protein